MSNVLSFYFCKRAHSLIIQSNFVAQSWHPAVSYKQKVTTSYITQLLLLLQRISLNLYISHYCVNISLLCGLLIHSNRCWSFVLILLILLPFKPENNCLYWYIPAVCFSDGMILIYDVVCTLMGCWMMLMSLTTIGPLRLLSHCLHWHTIRHPPYLHALVNIGALTLAALNGTFLRTAHIIQRCCMTFIYIYIFFVNLLAVYNYLPFVP